MNSSTIFLNNFFSKADKKKEGIFFSPIPIIKTLIDKVKSYITDIPIEILEPSCGSCEIIDYLQINGYHESNIDAIEYNKIIFDNILEIHRNNVNYININYMHYDIENHKKYDLIIGNPPYFVISIKDIPFHFIGKSEDEKYFEGRPQIFIIFLFHSLHKLKTGGILAFILPKSIMNSQYYKKMRQYIYDNYELLEIIDFSNIQFEDTTQETIGIIIRNNKINNNINQINNPYIFIINDNIIWTMYKNELIEIYKNATSLYMLGFSVKTGPVTWNEHKDKLTDNIKDSLLIYNTNINNNKLVIKNFKNDEKKQYIQYDGKSESLPIIVCNRGNGNSKYKLNFCYIDEDYIKNKGIKSVVIENHLNVIYHKTANTKDKINMMKKIVNQLNNNKNVQKWCDLFLGNNGFSKTELEHYFPIYL